MAKINAVLRHHYGIEPEELSDLEWARLFNEWTYVERQKARIQETVLKKALSEVLSAAFGKKG